MLFSHSIKFLFYLQPYNISLVIGGCSSSCSKLAVISKGN